MERLCPYLALSADGRTAVAGYDADHRCQAVDPPAALERSRQIQLCLSELHAGCERFQAIEAGRRDAAGWPLAPDARLPRTRLVIQADPAWRAFGAAAGAAHGRGGRLLAGGVTAVIGLVAVAGGTSGTIGTLFGATSSATPSRTPAPQPLGNPSIDLDPPATAAPSVAADPVATQIPQTPPPASPTATPAPTPRTYVVQSGDTLTAIATRFGTSVSAIRAANGLSGDVINIGQALVIP